MNTKVSFIVKKQDLIENLNNDCFIFIYEKTGLGKLIPKDDGNLPFCFNTIIHNYYFKS